VTARRYLRKMRGGTQAHLLEASDGAFYIVKFSNNLQHRRVLINELLAAEILKYLRITSPEYRIIYVSSEFLALNTEICIQMRTGRREVTPGWHFASRHPGDPDTLATYDFIPDTLLKQVVNLDQFKAVLVFDRWVSNSDCRQSIFFRTRLRHNFAVPQMSSQRLGYLVSMIDNGLVFDGPGWTLRQSAITGLYPQPLVYESVDSIDAFDPWMTRVLNFPDEVLTKALGIIPPEWLAGDERVLNRLLEALIRRQSRIGDLMQDCRSARASLFPNWN
jgi:hypothetical protein